jgi:magnesium transporter
LEEYDDYLFMVIPLLLSGDSEPFQVETEQVSLILMPNMVLVFCERYHPAFDTIKARIRSKKGRLHRMPTDFLTYQVLDVIVDHYFITIDQLDDQTTEMEDKILLGEVSHEMQALLLKLKRDVIQLRHKISPVRELVSGLLHSDSEMIHESTRLYLNDLYDHVVRVLDSIESYRDITAGILDIYMSSVSNRMNEIMKFLTMFSTIFIPLTFIAGNYGMNFRWIPELEFKWGYPLVLMSYLVIVLIMLRHFKKKGWLD